MFRRCLRFSAAALRGTSKATDGTVPETTGTARQEQLQPPKTQSSEELNVSPADAAGGSLSARLLRQVRLTATRQRFHFYHQAPLRDKWLHINTALATLGHVSPGNKITPFYDSGDAFRSMWAAVDNAKHSVRWQTYICKNDTVGKITMQKLVDAKHRGCVVELLYDSGGNMSGRQEMMAPLMAEGIQVTEYRPFFPFIAHYFNYGMQWMISPGIRNHRKLLIIDNEIGYVGGLNIGDDYGTVEVGGNGRFRDTQCRIEGPAVQDLLTVYQNTLQSSRGPSDETVDEALLDSERRKKVFQRWRHWAGRTLRFRTKVLLTTPFRRAVKKSSVGIKKKLLRRASRVRVVAKGAADEISAKKSVIQARKKWAVARREWKQRLSDRFARGKRLLEAPAKKHHKTSEKAIATFLELKRKGAHLQEVVRESISDRLEKRRQRRRAEEMVAQQLLADDAAQSGLAQVLPCSPPQRDWSLQMAFWLVVKKSHARVWITTPYFVPNRKLMNAVLCAARRGVDVRIMVGGIETSDPWFMWYVGQYVSHQLLSAGVRIFEYQEPKRVMHAKTLVVDSTWASIGSYNWDVLSNKLLEVSVAGYDTALAEEMEAHFEKDMSLSTEVTKDVFQSRPWYRRLACCVSYHLVKFSEKVSFWDYTDADLTSRLD